MTRCNLSTQRCYLEFFKWFCQISNSVIQIKIWEMCFLLSYPLFIWIFELYPPATEMLPLLMILLCSKFEVWPRYRRRYDKLKVIQPTVSIRTPSTTGLTASSPTTRTQTFRQVSLHNSSIVRPNNHFKISI